MNETSDKLRIFIINMAAQSLGELQESEIISKVNDTVENMLHLFVWASKVFTTKSISKKSTGKPHQLNEAVNKNIQRRHDQASCLLRYPRLP